MGPDPGAAAPDQRRRQLGADVVYGCVGKAAAWTEGIGYLRDGEGRFVEVGLAGDDGPVSFNPSTQLVAKNATFIGALGVWIAVAAHSAAAATALSRGHRCGRV